MQITIKRMNEKEINQAIAGLERRGYEVVFPPKQIGEDGKMFSTDDRKRQIFYENTFHSYWVAKMRKKEKHGNEI